MGIAFLEKEENKLEKLGETANGKIPNGNPKDAKYKLFCPKCHANNFLASLGKKKDKSFCTGVS